MRRALLAFLFLILNSVLALGQVFIFKLSGAKTDYKWSDSISRVPLKLAGSGNSAIHTTTDSSGYFFDGKKIKRNKEYIVRNVIGQENKFTISGTVTDCKTHLAIKGVTIKLVGSDKSSIETKSDSTGNYFFSNCFKTNTGYVISTQVGNDVGVGKAIRYGICPYEDHETNGYLNGSEKYKFTTPDTLSNQKQIQNFCLAQILSCGWTLPDFYFKENSTDFLSVDWYQIVGKDTAIDCLVSFLMAHKSWTFEISAHASKDEKNKKELAEARGKKLLDLLVSKGIEPERLNMRSYSDTKPIELYDDFGKMVTKDIKITNEKSRRVRFQLLRKDYVPSSTKEITTPIPDEK